MPGPRRIAVISNAPPVVVPLVATLRDLRHEPVAWLTQRRPGAAELPVTSWGDIADRTAPEGTSLTDPGDGARSIECADGPIWVVESEPATSSRRSRSRRGPSVAV